jgi:hypothetical protein
MHDFHIADINQAKDDVPKPWEGVDVDACSRFGRSGACGDLHRRENKASRPDRGGQFLLAIAIAEEVSEMGGWVIGPAHTLSEALSFARTEALDAALLDVSLGDLPSFAVAHVLMERRVPFVFTGSDEPPERAFQSIPILGKPFGSSALRRALAELMGPTELGCFGG